MEGFVNLHVHDAFGSLLDSILKPEDVAKFAHEHGQKAIAITNHGYMSSFVAFHKECLKYNIKPIHGCEIYECDDDQEKNDTKDYKQPRYHLVLLAKSKLGLQNLFKIVSYGCTDGFYKKPRISIQRIYENGWGEGIVCLTGCQAGRISKLLVEGDKNEAKRFYSLLCNTFDRTYLELQSHDTPEQAHCNRLICDFASSIEGNCVLTTDAHMLSPDQMDSHSIFVEIGEGREVGEAYTDCYLQDYNDVIRTMHGKHQSLTDNEINTAIANSLWVADQIDVIDIGLTKKAIMPKVSIEGDFESHEEYLRHLIYSTFDQKFGHMSEAEQQKRRDRIETELPVLFALEYTDYFIMLYMLIDAFRKANIPLGYARGSAAGSLCLYMLNVTQIDSVRWKLDFSRFANLGRRSMADCDIDISKRRRREAVEIASQLFGKQNVAPICTFNTLTTKVAIRDVGKVLNDRPDSPYRGKIPYSLRDEVAKLIPDISVFNDLGEEEKKETLLQDALRSNSKLQDIYAEFPLWFMHVMVLANLPRSRGRHAAGTLITPDPIISYCPICMDKDGETVTQIEMHAAMDDLGLVKMDFLGLKTLDVIDDALHSANLTWQDVDIDHLDLDDPLIYRQVYQPGNTVGVFQMESYEARRMCIDSKADDVENIVVVNAANRPGTKDSFPDYCKNKLFPEQEVPIHPDLSKMFKASHGILLYQEQALQVFRYAGFPEENVDNARRCIGKKDLDKMKSLEIDLRKGLKAKGWTDAQCDAIWELLLKQASYSFNRCVAGDTYIYRGNSRHCQPTVAEMYQIKHDKEYAIKAGHRTLHDRYNGKGGYGTAYSMYEDGRVRKNQIVDIYFSGRREVYEITTMSGKTIQCTPNHKFPTPSGITKLCEMKLGDELYIMSKYGKQKTDKSYSVSVDRIVSIKSAGFKDTYDVEMEDPAHNFVVSSGIITSNSHAVAYGLLSYLTAYLKVHYPTEFLASCLSNDSDNVSKIGVFINEAKRLGIKVLPPHVNRSERNFTPIAERKEILFGLLAIKGLGESAVNQIIEQRPYAGFNDFLSKVSGKATIVSLIKAGAIPTKDKMKMLRRYADYCYTPLSYKEVSTLPTKAKLLLDWGLDQEDYKDGKKVNKEWLLKDYNRLRFEQYQRKENERKSEFIRNFQDAYCQYEFLWEFETLSMFITNDPLQEANQYITRQWCDVPENEVSVIVCVITGVDSKKDRNGNPFAYLDLYTPYGIIEATCWSRQMKEYHPLIKKGNCVVITGRKAEGEHLFVESMKPYTQWLHDRQLKLPH